MDFDLAAPVHEALRDALDIGDCGYAGIGELAESFATFAEQRFGWKVEESRIFAVPDVMAGVAESIRLLTSPGCSVVINPPVYPPFFETIRAAGREIVEVPLLQDRQRGWVLDFDSLEEAFHNGAQAYLLCHPHNPVGRVWNPEELEQIAALAAKYNVAVISDEVHAPLTMPGVEYLPFLRFVRGWQPSTAITSASKAWNIAGLKCALLVAGSNDVRKALHERVRSAITEIRDRIGHLGAIGNVAAFRHGGPWLDAALAHLDGNRRLFAALIEAQIPQIRYRMPEASYLAWLDCTDLGLGPDPAEHFLTHGRVALEPGHKFGKPGENYVRVNMGTSSNILREIVDRMAAALNG